MRKIKALPIFRSFFIVMGACDDANLSSCQKNCFTIMSVVISVLVLSLFCISTLYCVIHIRAGDLETSIYAFFQMAATGLALPSFIWIVSKKMRMKMAFDKFQELIDNCEFVVK